MLIEYPLSICCKVSQLDDEWKDSFQNNICFVLLSHNLLSWEMQLNIRIINAYQFLKVLKQVVKIEADFWLNNEI